LARPIGELQSHYDAVVVGSGYGGGGAAARPAPAGKRGAVLQRRRAVLTRGFSTPLPPFPPELPGGGQRIRIGRATALYDVRLGEDMHVLVGCGLGGGSLINAGVALWPDSRVLSDAVWPEELGDGLLAEGHARALRFLRPARDPAADQHD